ncbi:MAG: 3-phosphoshikimate 1-carboxyvinyltransferase [Bacteroidales bacterium]|nr:3-phosphoshikimate 1-carboxyvinyltransferase [Bacteroidales bacterium]
MNSIVSRSKIDGSIVAPTSKSALQRHIVAAMLAKGKSVIHFESMSEDAEAVLGVAKSLGGRVVENKNSLEIVGGINNPAKNLYIGESGLGLRMLSPILAATAFPFEISGSGSLLKRPVDFVVDTLLKCGVEIKSTEGSLPLKMQGPINNNLISIDGSVGSQLLTGFLMAAPLLNNEVKIKVVNLKSKPYIDLTISILNHYGIEVVNKNYEQFLIGSDQIYKACNSYAEGDWSGAAFVLVAAAITGKIHLKGIDNHSLQGDKQIVHVLKMAGAEIQEFNNELIVEKNQLNAFEFDATDVPDLFPPLVSLAVNCIGISKIKGVSRLKHKESDRANTLKQEFEKLGASVILDGDYMMVEGTRLHGGHVSSHNDHRIAMALAVAALTSDGEVVIEASESVAKSWPDFFEKLSQLGANIMKMEQQ